jgi:transposase-like protein
MSNQRRKYPTEKKVEILREYLNNKVPISELCEKYDIQPNMF